MSIPDLTQSSNGTTINMNEITLLLVDDIAENIIALSALIESAFDAKILTAANGSNALKILLEKEHNIDLILCDVQMPEMDGFELASTLKRKQSSRDIPIIFISASCATSSYQKKGYDLGAIDYINKPIDPHLLISRVRTYLNLSKTQKQLRQQTLQLSQLNSALEDNVKLRTLELEKSETRFREMFENHDAMMLLLNVVDHSILDANPSACRFYGYSQEAFKSMLIEDLNDVMQVLSNYASGVSIEKKSSFELLHRLKNGKSRTVEIYSSQIAIDHQPILFWIIHDITERKKAEQHINHLAFYDPLTELPNRRLFEDRLLHSMQTSIRTQQYGALMFIDLDNFKILNDTQGHDIGDMLLIEVGERLKKYVRNSDTVARLGGDEFTVLLEALDTDEHLAAHRAHFIAEKVRTELAKPYTLLENIYHTSPSIGVVLFQGDDKQTKDLFKYADSAMYKAKSKGRNNICFYNPNMQDELNFRVALENDMRDALALNQFSLYYQIQVKNTRPAIGAEALLRWNHPQRGFVPPAQFIPLAEETGLISAIGSWVLRTACEQIKSWSDNPLTKELTVSINVSAQQFQHTNFINDIRQAINQAGIDPSRLKLELTETVVLRDVDRCIAHMHDLKKIGVRLSIDDFGTGYSSLNYLKQLPIDELKIDQSFVRDLGYDDNDAAIVKAIITLGRVFGLNVIAEGVETDTQREFLFANGCFNYQGYLFSKPIPAEAFAKLIESYSEKSQVQLKFG